MAICVKGVSASSVAADLMEVFLAAMLGAYVVFEEGQVFEDVLALSRTGSVFDFLEAVFEVSMWHT